MARNATVTVDSPWIATTAKPAQRTTGGAADTSRSPQARPTRGATPAKGPASNGLRRARVAAPRNPVTQERAHGSDVIRFEERGRRDGGQPGPGPRGGRGARGAGSSRAGAGARRDDARGPDARGAWRRAGRGRRHRRRAREALVHARVPGPRGPLRGRTAGARPAAGADL